MRVLVVVLMLIAGSVPLSAADAGGRAFPPPDLTFTLPAPAPGGGIWYTDLQASFPGVDWADLDRLYIPAGHYPNLLLGGFPDRSASDPLVITNTGGQVRVGGLGFSSYVVVLRGGSNWVLTGEYDPDAATGDAAYPGHAEGYASPRGRYGIFIDDALEDAGNSGLAVGGGATAFELAFVEVTRVGFAGLLIKTDDDPTARMSDVTIRDLYIHDVGSEGIYLGSTQSGGQHDFTGIEIVNNRVLRTGTEMLQVGQLGGGCEIHHNVFAFGALDWKNPFGPYQDNGSQIGVRWGSGSIHHNIFIGGASTLFQFFPQPRAGDPHTAGDTFSVHDNVFTHSRNFGAYLHADSDELTTYCFDRNLISEINFHYDELEPGATDVNTVFRTFNTASPMVFTDNHWAGPQVFLQGGGGNISTSGNVHEGEIAPVVFEDWGFPLDFDPHRLEIWTDLDRHGQPVSYQEGDMVLHQGLLYLCIEPGSHTGKEPPNHPATWALQPAPADDVRLAPVSPHQHVGLLDHPFLFVDDFETGDTAAWSSTTP